MEKKIIELRITNTIPALIKSQKNTVYSLSDGYNERSLGIQEDILTVLETVKKMEIVYMDVD